MYSIKSDKRTLCNLTENLIQNNKDRSVEVKSMECTGTRTIAQLSQNFLLDEDGISRAKIKFPSKVTVFFQTLKGFCITAHSRTFGLVSYVTLTAAFSQQLFHSELK